jgi:membrane protease YdiL (CAAX protease family)
MQGPPFVYPETIMTIAAHLLESQRHQNAAISINICIDILIVLLASALVYLLEGAALELDWLDVGDEARGASAVVAGALVAVAVVLWRGGSLNELGFKRPKSWLALPFQALAVLAAFVAMQVLVPQVIALFVDLPAPDMSRYASVTGNLGAAISMALILPLTASIPEEIIYRGFLMGRLSELFGTGTRGNILTVLVQALIFGSIHFTWGIGGVLMTFMMGLVWGTAYLLCDRNLWVVIFAHSAGHILFITQLYLGASFTA